MPQADLAVSPFTNHLKLQTKKGQSTSKKVQSIPMQRAHGKVNKKQRSFDPTSVDEISDSEDDFPITDSPLKTKQSALTRQSREFHAATVRSNATHWL